MLLPLFLSLSLSFSLPPSLPPSLPALSEGGSRGLAGPAHGLRPGLLTGHRRSNGWKETQFGFSCSVRFYGGSHFAVFAHSVGRGGCCNKKLSLCRPEPRRVYADGRGAERQRGGPLAGPLLEPSRNSYSVSDPAIALQALVRLVNTAYAAYSGSAGAQVGAERKDSRGKTAGKGKEAGEAVRVVRVVVGHKLSGLYRALQSCAMNGEPRSHCRARLRPKLTGRSTAGRCLKSPVALPASRPLCRWRSTQWGSSPRPRVKTHPRW